MLARPYAGAADLPCMTALAAHNLDARRGRSCWHPGDIVWMMLTHSHMGLFDNRRDIRLWLNDAGDCVALAWFYGPLFARFDVGPDHAHLGGEVLGWIENHVPILNPGGNIRLRVDAMDDDEEKCALLARAGYRAGRRFSDVLCADLDRFAPTQDMPPGMVVRDCVEIDERARARCHRDAWSALGHIGRPDTVSQFHDHIYRALRRAIRYDPELDLVVATADGELAACSIAWADDLSRFGVLEPVGTCPAYRGLRLSAILVEQSMLRLRERGMQHAYVMSSEADNPTAYRAYRRSFEPIGRQRYHYKDFPSR